MKTLNLNLLKPVKPVNHFRALFTGLAFLASATTGWSQSLPTPWLTQDIGAVGAAGSASYSNGTFTVAGAGAGITGTADEFRFVYQAVTGDFEIKARVVTQQNTQQYCVAGVMFRETLTAGSKFAATVLTPNGINTRWRATTGGNYAYGTNGSGAVPYWIRLVRSGDTFTAYKSSDGSSWTTLASPTITMASTIYVGLAVTSNVDATLSTDTFDNVTVQAAGSGGLPSPWVSQDIGAVGAAGSASYANGTFTVTGSGAGITGTADEFRYAYQSVSGDFEIKARVVTQQNTQQYCVAGVMFRETLTAGSKFAATVLTPNGINTRWRATTGGNYAYGTNGSGAVPYWIRLVRSGDTFTAYKSSDGSSWTTLASPTITMASTIYVGLAVTSNVDATLSTDTFDNVAVQAGGGVEPPVITSSGTATATVGTPFNYQIVATNSPTSYGATGLPSGLTVNTTTGVISGTPSATGTPSVTLSATNSAGTGNKTLVITINAASGGSGIWISQNEIMARPMSGTAWNTLKTAADGDWGTANLSDQNSGHDVKTYAGALVYVRTGTASYRTKTLNAIMSVIGTENNPHPECNETPSHATGLSIGRNLMAYIIAADIIGLRPGTDSGKGQQWFDYVVYMQTHHNCSNTGGTGGDISRAHDACGSNACAQQGGCRIAAALFVGDTAEVDKAWQTYQRYAGDMSKCPSCPMTLNDTSWRYDPDIARPINPLGATKNGHNIDGVVINDQSRGGSFAWPPGYTGYPWVGLEGFISQAHMLARAGYPAWGVSNEAPRRAVAYQRYLADQFGEQWWDRTHWVKYIVNAAYGTNFPTAPAMQSFMMGYTDWTHP